MIAHFMNVVYPPQFIIEHFFLEKLKMIRLVFDVPKMKNKFFKKKSIEMIKIISFTFLCFVALSCSKNTTTTMAITEKPTPAMLNVSMKKVPAGEFVMGSNKVDKEGMQKRYGFPAHSRE